jgi:hypothetical protein
MKIVDQPNYVGKRNLQGILITHSLYYCYYGLNYAAAPVVEALAVAFVVSSKE